MSLYTRILLATAFLFSSLLLPLGLSAQLTKSSFGKNRLQYKEFNWRYYSTSNFDIYFYDDGQELAKLSAAFIEDEYDRITDLLGYAPYSKTKIFLYNSLADLQQSNVGANSNPFTVGGQTNFVKSQVEIAFPGTLQEFKDELVLRVSQMLLMDMMFGGSLSDIFQNTYLMTLPDWFLDGAARYVAYGWGIQMDDFVRDEFKDGKAPKLTKLKGLESALMGQAVWNFIAEEYGRSNISNILNYTRIIRNEQMAISNTLGMPYRQFTAAWQRYYANNAQQVLVDYTVPPADNLVTEKRSGLHLHNSVAVSPGGRYLAFTENHKGRYSIKVKDLTNNRIKTVMVTGYRTIDQQADDTIPLVDWQDSTSLGVMSVRKGLYTLYLVNVLNEQTERQTIRKVSQVNDFSFSPNGSVIAMSAEKEGRNDIYLYSLKRKTLTAITNDWYDDVTPSFIPGSNNIIFSSNRTSDTLNVREKAPLGKISRNYNIYIYDIDTTTNVLARVTNTLGKSYKPTADSVGNVYFLSEQRGITNLFRYSLPEGLYFQLTKYFTGIEDYDLNPSTGAFAFITLYDGSERIFYVPSQDLKANNFTKPTRRQGILQTRQLYQNRSKEGSATTPKGANQQRKATPPDTVAATTPAAGDSLQARPAQPTAAQPTAVQPNVTQPNAAQPNADQPTAAQPQPAEAAAEPEEAVAEEPGLINTDNYTFDTSAPQVAGTTKPEENKQQVQERRSASFLSAYRQTRRKDPLQGPYRMEQRFMVNNLVTSIAFDPLRASVNAGSLGFVVEGELNDLLENHKIYAGILAMADLRSGDLFLEYQYLKELVDIRARIDRRVLIVPLIQPERDKYILNRANVSFSYPFSVSSRIEGGPVAANTIYLPVVDPQRTSTLSDTRKETFYAGGNIQAVFDNTQVQGFNILRGTRGRLGYEHLLGVGQSEMGFGKISGEIRHYQPISREITLAARVVYGRFTGQNKPLYVLGGMDNWFLNKTEYRDPENEPLLPSAGPEYGHQDRRNLLFYEYVMPLRGFGYNVLHGTNVLAMNLELRVPLVQYFYRGPISSNFFRNLQFTGFFDIGSSWSGKAPFYAENSVNTKRYRDKGGSFDISVVDYKNPWLSGTGFGMRTVLLGYYAKFDVGYPIEDYKIGDPRFYFTLGFDF